MYSTKDLAGKVSHLCGSLSITAVGKELWKASSGRNSHILCYLYLHTQMYFVVKKSDIHLSMCVTCFSCTDKLYGYMIHGKAVSMLNIYLPFSLTVQSTLWSLSSSGIYLKPPRSFRKSPFFEKKASFFLCFPKCGTFCSLLSTSKITCV